MFKRLAQVKEKEERNLGVIGPWLANDIVDSRRQNLNSNM